jgi:hypothetical protein
MGIQKKLTYIGLFFAFIVLIYFLFSTEGGGKQKSKLKSEDLSFLLGGTGSISSSQQGTNGMGSRGENSKSVFDSDFYQSGGIKYEEDGTNPISSVQGEAPINPQTGKPYPEEAMAQFDRLREMFPDNNLIPKRMTPEIKAAEEAKTQKLADSMRNVFANNAKPEEIQYYYTNMEKQSQDRLQIIEYLIEAQGGEDEEMDKKFKEVLDGVKAQNEQIQKEKEEAYKKAGL